MPFPNEARQKQSCIAFLAIRGNFGHQWIDLSDGTPTNGPKEANGLFHLHSKADFSLTIGTSFLVTLNGGSCVKTSSLARDQIEVSNMVN